MEGDLYAVCELTPEQQRAFNRLKRRIKTVKKQEFTLLIITVI